jgi:uncharacterized phage-associated protein
MNKVPIIIEALGYLLYKLRRADKIQLVKLMYLADKYHVMSYGRTITGDTFLALEHGPAGSQTIDILEYDKYILGDCLEAAKDLVKKGKGYCYHVGDKCNPKSFDMLSESDIEALDFAVHNFGTMNKWDIVDYTHKLKEWKRFKPLFESGKTKQEPIKTEELLWPVNDKYFNISQEHLKESRRALTGSSY